MIELITKAEAARMLTVSEDTLDRLIRAGMLPVYRISAGITRLDRADVEKYIESRRVRSSALAAQIRPFGVKDLRRKRQMEELPCGYYPGMKVV